jgi:hypothetical protein
LLYEIGIVLGKNKKDKKDKKDKKNKLKDLKTKGLKSNCCEKYRKSESKRCGRCPCFDLVKEKAA